jgi:hypothetical protein
MIPRFKRCLVYVLVVSLASCWPRLLYVMLTKQNFFLAGEYCIHRSAV